MEWWVILLIVLGSIIGLIIIFSTCIFIYAGNQTVKMLKRCDNGFKGMNIDVSFYQNGPVAPLAEEGVKYLNSLEHEDIILESFDGLKLHAYLYKNPYKKTNKYFLGMHGFKSGPIHEYAPYAKRYFDLGFNIIVPDERSHYKSEGKYITMGVNERYDVLTWCNYLVERFGKDISILIQGISMGGASVCLASNLELPSNVIGIISDCAYASFKDEIAFTMNNFNPKYKIPSFPLVNVIEMNIKHRVGFDFKGETPLSAVRHARVPMLFIHGEKDQMVPVKFAKELYEACEQSDCCPSDWAHLRQSREHKKWP